MIPCEQFRDEPDYETMNRFLMLLIEYMPSLTISALNMIIPIFFGLLVKIEDYHLETSDKITIAR